MLNTIVESSSERVSVLRSLNLLAAFV